MSSASNASARSSSQLVTTPDLAVDEQRDDELGAHRDGLGRRLVALLRVHVARHDRLAEPDAEPDQAVVDRLAPVLDAKLDERLAAAGCAVDLAVVADPYDGAAEEAEGLVQLVDDRAGDGVDVGHRGQARPELVGERELAGPGAEPLGRALVRARLPLDHRAGRREPHAAVARGR